MVCVGVVFILPDATLTLKRMNNGAEMQRVDVEVVSDFICPWCWIGHRNLKEGIRIAGLNADRVRVRFSPFELNPAMPLGGLSRREYRTRKFGSWARSQSMDAEVTLAGRRVGAEFNYDRVEVTPNTRLAHRLMGWAQQHGDNSRVEALPEAIFAAYFSEGNDIGAVDVLVEIATSTGFDADAVRAFLLTQALESEVTAKEHQAQANGVQSVPSIRIAGHHISGAQPPAVMANILRAASSSQSLT